MICSHNPDTSGAAKAFTPNNIIACGSLYHELESVKRDDQQVTIHYLDTDLHRTPAKIPAILQKNIDIIEHSLKDISTISDKSKIILGYGLCSNAVVGVTTKKSSLVVPRVHDCLDLFLGFVGKGVSRSGVDIDYNNSGNNHNVDSSIEVENARDTGKTHHYFLTPGTLLNHKDPYSIMVNEYTPKMGEKIAQWGMKEELKHYTHFDLIATLREDMDEIRQQALKNADFFNMELVEIQSDLKFFDRLVNGPHDEDYFIHIQPGEIVEQAMFF
ncbi:conserved hypothetical protein [Desulfamplus magnetovallimortis]|uniref:DUF1638 domain-containing protein n=1 Tax=Desulfamplus magnetovallimortis TaxID=1246637 RepID=A0A1W1HHB4_9BACT|nr:DUF1638 domain-containing protein [Desulfamplus magnetovallimortis]SLM31772.1 conserved hypothetical protein [Desulfamplus magnetovallimortis]